MTNVKTGGCGGTSVIGLGYDVQGNLANKNGQTFSFDYGNRLRSSDTPATNYVYDGQGRRVRDLTTGVSRYRFYTQAGQLAFNNDYRTLKTTNYFYLGGSLVAARETPQGGGTAVIKYQHTDALGSPVAVTDASRTVIEQNEYEPFGKVINHPLKDGPGYTGHVVDAATGMIYMQQRYYDDDLGRSPSMDPVTATSIGGNFNRYWYADNNPYKFTDPDGRHSCEGGVTFCSAIDGYAAALRESRDGLEPGTRDYRRVQSAVTEMGEKGSGPKFIQGDLKTGTLANNDQNGTITIDTTQVNQVSSDSKIAAAEIGAQVTGHELDHGASVRKNGPAKTLDAVKKSEQSAYSTSRAIDAGFGRNWTNEQYQEAVNGSVENWKIRQKEESK